MTDEAVRLCGPLIIYAADQAGRQGRKEGDGQADTACGIAVITVGAHVALTGPPLIHDSVLSFSFFFSAAQFKGPSGV